MQCPRARVLGADDLVTQERRLRRAQAVGACGADVVEFQGQDHSTGNGDDEAMSGRSFPLLVSGLVVEWPRLVNEELREKLLAMRVSRSCWRMEFSLRSLS